MNAEPKDRHPVVKDIVDRIKSEGIFDELRKECLGDVDTKPAYDNLKHKVQDACSQFLSQVVWSSSLNKIQLREQMKRSLEESGVLLSGVKRLVNQVVNPRIDRQVKPKVAQVVCEHLGLNPEEIIGVEEGEEDFTADVDVTRPPPTVSLYPYNPYGLPMVPCGLLPPSAAAPPPLPPGFDDYSRPPPPLPDAPPLPPDLPEEEEGATAGGGTVSGGEDDDMEISDRSGAASRLSSKTDADAEFEQTGDLSRGLAAYMAQESADGRRARPADDDADDMSISSGSGSSKTGPDSGDGNESARPSGETSSSRPTSAAAGEEAAATPPPRRQMRRHRTRNKKYLSDDFLSIFTEQTDLLSRIYGDDNGDGVGGGVVLEEEVVLDTDYTSEVAVPVVSGLASADSAADTHVQPELAAGGSADTPASRPASAASTNSSSGSKKASKSTTDSQPCRRSLRQKQKQQQQEQNPEHQNQQQQQQQASCASEAPATLPEADAGSAVTKPSVEKDDVGHRVLRSGRAIRSASAVAASTDAAEADAGQAGGDHDGGEPVPFSQSKIPSQSEEMDVCSELSGGTPVQDERLSISGESDQVMIVIDSLPEEGEEEDNITDHTVAASLSNDTTAVHAGTPSPSMADRPTSPLTHPAPAGHRGDGPDDVGEDADDRAVAVALSGAEAGEAGELLDDQLGEGVAAAEGGEEEEGGEGEEGAEGAEGGDGEVDQETDEEDIAEDGELEDEEDLKELERLAQRKLEILKAIEMPDSVMLDRGMGQLQAQLSSEEEGEITDSSSEEERRRKKKSKKSKKKKSKSRKHKRRAPDSPPPSPGRSPSGLKRRRYY